MILRLRACAADERLLHDCQRPQDGVRRDLGIRLALRRIRKNRHSLGGTTVYLADDQLQRLSGLVILGTDQRDEVADC